MANAMYDLGREKFLKGDIDWENDDIRVAAVDATYVPNLATDEFLNIISGGDIVAVSASLASKTFAAGVADAANITYPLITGNPVVTLVIYKHTGTSSTSPLIGKIDAASNLPFTPDGTDKDIVWDNGGNKIFKL